MVGSHGTVVGTVERMVLGIVVVELVVELVPLG